MLTPATHRCPSCDAAGWYLTDNPVYCTGRTQLHDPLAMDRIMADGRRVPYFPPEDSNDQLTEVGVTALHTMAITWMQQAGNPHNMFTDTERMVWREAARKLADAIERPL